MSGPERLGIFGGSFDPVHLGHLHVARAATAAFGLDTVLFVPAARPPHKPGQVLAPAADRLAMLELALRAEPLFTVDPLELGRAGPSYTIDSVREIEARPRPLPPELYLLIGADNLAGLPSWKGVVELLRRVQPVVVQRAGQPRELPAEVRAALGLELAARLEQGMLLLPPVELSATDLRAELGQGRAPRGALPDGVLEYVLAHGLYGCDSN